MQQSSLAAADKLFPKGGNPKTGHPTSPPGPLTAGNRFRPNFPVWRLDEFSIFARPPPGGVHPPPTLAAGAAASRPRRQPRPVDHDALPADAAHSTVQEKRIS